MSITQASGYVRTRHIALYAIIICTISEINFFLFVFDELTCEFLAANAPACTKWYSLAPGSLLCTGQQNQVTDGYRPLILNHSVVGLLRFIKTRVDQTASY